RAAELRRGNSIVSTPSLRLAASAIRLRRFAGRVVLLSLCGFLVSAVEEKDTAEARKPQRGPNPDHLPPRCGRRRQGERAPGNAAAIGYFRPFSRGRPSRQSRRPGA